MSSSEEDDENRLGRHDFWEATYAKELANLDELGDEGEIWFGKAVLETMVGWTDELLQKRLDNAHDATILDLGTGNGSFLFALSSLGYKNLSGCDYSEQSIFFAKAIAKKRAISNIHWIHDDLLDSKIGSRFQVLTDKGTLDAIGLMSNAEQHRVEYKNAAWNLLEDNGLLIITSCNSTAEELQEEICKGKGHNFQFVDKVQSYPRFRFGGVEGTKVCTLAFVKFVVEFRK